MIWPDLILGLQMIIIGTFRMKFLNKYSIRMNELMADGFYSWKLRQVFKFAHKINKSFSSTKAIKLKMRSCEKSHKSKKNINLSAFSTNFSSEYIKKSQLFQRIYITAFKTQAKKQICIKKHKISPFFSTNYLIIIIFRTFAKINPCEISHKPSP